MKIVKVTYASQPGFAIQNALNIQSVINDLRNLKKSGIFYHACLAPDGKAFTHIAFFESEEDHQVLNQLPSFKYFQEQLKNGGFETQPKQEFLTMIGSSSEFLDKNILYGSVT